MIKAFPRSLLIDELKLPNENTIDKKDVLCTEINTDKIGDI